MFSRSSRNVRLCALSLLALTGPGAWAQPLTTAFLYQGELRTTGVPASGLHDLRFRLFDALAGGAQVGATLCIDNVNLANGRFTVPLDFGAQFSGQQRFLEIEVRADTGLTCATPAGLVLLTPRQGLTGAPNALFALNAAAATSATTAATATNATQLNGQAASFYSNAANLTGTLPGGTLLGTYGNALTFSNATNIFTGSGSGLTGLSASNVAAGTLADARLSGNVALLNAAQTFSAGKTFAAAPSFTAAGSPFAVTSGTLVANLNADLLDGLDSSAFLQSIPVPLTLTGTSAATHIIRGENTSTVSGSSGMHGESSSVGGLGVIGIASSTSPFQPSFGGLFESSGPLGRGVRGTATSLTGTAYGGHFVSNSSAGRGVFGEATSTTGTTYGGFFENESILGRAVYGKAAAFSGSNYGGHFDSDSTSGTGVFGNVTASSGTNYGGFFRSNSPTGFGALSVNLALGTAFDVELSGPNGAINTPGFVYREYTGSTRSAAIPVAYGSISAAGAISGGTGNFTVSHSVTGEYDITISGETYSSNTFAVSITPLINNAPYVGNVGDVGVAFRVNMWNLVTGAKADLAFQFVVYATNPSEPG